MNSRYIKKRSKKKGLPPGTLVHIGEEKGQTTRFTLFHYTEGGFTEKTLNSAADCQSFLGQPGVLWIDLDGISDTATVAHLGQLFKLHPLVQEDIVNTDQRPKIEEYDSYLYLVMKMIYHQPGSGHEIISEQISFILGANFVLTFQETAGDVFDPLRERIRTGKGLIRRYGADHLVYSLMDAVIDSYFSVIEKRGDELEELEDEVVSRPSPATLSRIHRLKREMIFLRKAIWPLRELIGRLENLGLPLIQPGTAVYLRDIHDHSIQLIDSVETFRDMLSGLLDIYLSSINNRLNEIMKVLTIIATIFMPLTFLTGLYGMNFKYMPGLNSLWGFPLILAFMAMVLLVMLGYFRRKRWL